MNAQTEFIIAEKTRDFVGRENVFTAIIDFLNQRPNGYFVLEADPGAGKSSIIAELARRTGWPVHFNIRAQGVSGFQQFIDNISEQVSSHLKPSLASQADMYGSPSLLANFLHEASGFLASPSQRFVILIDALDEVDLTGHPPGVNILFLPQMLPIGVYFVLTKRRGDLPLNLAAPQLWYALDEHTEETDQDIRTYVEHAVQRPELQAWLESQNVAPETFAEVVADRSERNFMYLRYVLPEISSGIYGDWSAATLPRGLMGYYNDHWDRMGMRTSPVPRRKIRIIYVLAELQRAVSRRLLAQYSGEVGDDIDELAVQEVLDEWLPFLHVQSTSRGKRYSIYHASFRDFLHEKEVVKAAGITIQGINEQIGDDIWQDFYGHDT